MNMDSLFYIHTYIFILNMILFFFTHPIMKGLIIIFQVPGYCLYILFMTKSSWLAFILFITFVGGILILFIYMISLLDNKLTLSIWVKYLVIISTGVGIFIFFYKNLDTILYISDEEVVLIEFLNNRPLYLFIYMLYSEIYTKISLFMISYLFITMISILSIIKGKKNSSLKK